MHAFLIIGRDKDRVFSKAQLLSRDLGYELIAFTLQKISDAREISNFVSLKRSKIALFIESVDTATIEALNAFLKTLEESQENLSFILTAKSESSVLPTISSRCQIIRVQNSSAIDTTNAQDFLEMNEVQRLELVKTIKDREEAIEFVENYIFSLNSLLVIGNHKRIAQAVKTTEKTVSALKANGSVALQLANFAINL